MSWINDFVESVAKTEETIDPATWKPFPVGALTPYYFKYLVDKLYKAAKACEENKIIPETIAKNWKSQSWYRDQLSTLIDYLGLVKLNKKEKNFLVNFFLTLLCLNKDDPFALHGINRIYDQTTLNAIVTQLNWKWANGETAKELGFLITSLLTLSYTLYTDLFPAAGWEFHGPYLINKDSILIVRDFFDIKPTELWPECKAFKYNSVTIFTIYRKARFFIDYYGNLTCNKNMLQILKKYCIVIDNKSINSLRGISQLGDYFSQLTTNYYQKFQNLNFEQVKIKFMEAHFYGYKNVFNLVGIDWKPTPKAYQSIKNIKLLPTEKEYENWQEKWKKQLKDLQIIFPPQR